MQYPKFPFGGFLDMEDNFVFYFDGREFLLNDSSEKKKLYFYLQKYFDEILMENRMLIDRLIKIKEISSGQV